MTKIRDPPRHDQLVHRENPTRARRSISDSEAMKALEAYIYWSNTGSVLSPGKFLVVLIDAERRPLVPAFRCRSVSRPNIGMILEAREVQLIPEEPLGA